MKSFIKSILAVVGLLLGASNANAVTCFWVGGTATWDGTNTGGGGSGGIKWASASGGAVTCAGGGTGGSPGSGDSATFDGNSGGGTVTTNTNITLVTLTTSAFTGTLTFGTNNNTLTLTSQWVDAGSGAHTITGGTGAFTFTSTANITVLNLSGASTTYNLSSTPFTFAPSGTQAGTQTITTNAKTFGNLTITANSPATKFGFIIQGNATWGTGTITGSGPVVFPGNGTETFTGAVTATGTSTTQPLFLVSSTVGASTSPSTISVTGNTTISNAGLYGITCSNTGSAAATNSFNLWGDSSCSISAPSGGGGGGIIGTTF